METKVTVTVDLVIEHEGEIPYDQLEKLAKDNMHNYKLMGYSTRYGSYLVTEASRSCMIVK